ncbi:MAG: hypothetical protein ABEJ05_04430 [Haloglomus sp.]
MAVPSEFQSAGADGEALPEWRQAIAADIGEDPGRWLDRRLVEWSNRGRWEMSKAATLLAERRRGGNTVDLVVRFK